MIKERKATGDDKEFARKVHHHHIYIREIAILPEFQRKGIGTKIMQDILSLAKQEGLKIKLHVFKKNKAQDLYRKLGFKVAGTEDIKIEMEL